LKTPINKPKGIIKLNQKNDKEIEGNWRQACTTGLVYFDRLGVYICLYDEKSWSIVVEYSEREKRKREREF
jgi:hypothetical protein